MFVCTGVVKKWDPQGQVTVSKGEWIARDGAPYVAIIALEEDARSIVQPQKTLNFIDLLVEEYVGWSEDKSKSYDELTDDTA